MRLDITCTTTETNHDSFRLIAFMDGDKLSLNNQVGARHGAFGCWHCLRNVATAYFQLRALDAELDITKRTLASRQQSLRLTQALESHGGASGLDVSQSEQLVYTASETIPDFERQIQQQENVLSVLLGENPQSVPRGRALTEQPAPESVPAGLPSELLERRPDIRQAEEIMVAANAQIGVAKAAFFPRLSLTGLGGLESNALHQFITQPSETWAGAFNVSQPVFQGGALRSGLRLARANWQEAVLSYSKPFRMPLSRFPIHSLLLKRIVSFASNRNCSRRQRSGLTNCPRCFIRTAARATFRC